MEHLQHVHTVSWVPGWDQPCTVAPLLTACWYCVLIIRLLQSFVFLEKALKDIMLCLWIFELTPTVHFGVFLDPHGGTWPCKICCWRMCSALLPSVLPCKVTGSGRFPWSSVAAPLGLLLFYRSGKCCHEHSGGCLWVPKCSSLSSLSCTYSLFVCLFPERFELDQSNEQN